MRAEGWRGAGAEAPAANRRAPSAAAQPDSRPQAGTEAQAVSPRRDLVAAEAATRPRGSAAAQAAGTALILAFLLVPALATSRFAQGVATDLGHLALAALGLWFLKARAGVLCLGQSAFMGVGAYAYALAAVRGVPPPLAAALGGAAAVVVALTVSPAVVGSPTQGAALATLALVVVVQGAATGLRPVTGGASGLRDVPALAASRQVAAWLPWVAVVAGLLVLRWFLTTAPGRATRATRDDPVAAGRSGVNVRAVRRLALCICAALGGLSGAMTAGQFRFVSPDMFDIALSISILVMVVVGGEGFLGGPLMGAAFIYFLPDVVRASRDFQTLLHGTLLLLVTLYAPGGMAGAIAAIARWLKRWALGRGARSPRPSRP
ncbi:MAG: branched-chain amino acid ABC transporter permease [Acetobacteraceae bacterium]|nr:branched-chain amino acid ABC transporter permease [Acetobacteraceae bacterium]